MRLDIYVNYRGMCEEAFQYYERHLGGTITGLVRHGGQPNPNLPAGWGDKVLHGRIAIGSTVVMGADIPQADPMRSALGAILLLAPKRYSVHVRSSVEEALLENPPKPLSFNAELAMQELKQRRMFGDNATV